MHKLAISCERRHGYEINTSSILIDDGGLLVDEIRKRLIAASVPEERIITTFDGGTALKILEDVNIGNALLGHMPLSPGGDAEVAVSLQRFAEEGRNIVLYVNPGVAEALRAILADAKIQDKYLILDKLGGINPRHFEAKMRLLFPEIFPSLLRRFNSSLGLIAKRALVQSVRLRAGAAVAR